MPSSSSAVSSGCSRSMLRDLHAKTRSNRSAEISRRETVPPFRVCSQSSRFIPTTRRFSPCRQMMSDALTPASWTWAEITARSSGSSAINLSKGATATSIADTLDRGAAGRQLVFQTLKAAIEMIDPVGHGLAFRGQPRDHQRHRGAQIGRHHRRAAQLRDAVDGGGFAVEADPRAEPRQLLHMHKTIFENRLGDL